LCHDALKQLSGPIRQDFIHRIGKALRLVAARAAQTGARCPGGGRMACRRRANAVTAQRVVKSRARRSHLRSNQHNVRTVLSVVRKGRMWRVQITRPNGCVCYFGRFRSATRARDWIAAHARINPYRLKLAYRKRRCPLWVKLGQNLMSASRPLCSQ
jgi:hypothetical protein